MAEHCTYPPKDGKYVDVCERHRISMSFCAECPKEPCERHVTHIGVCVFSHDEELNRHFESLAETGAG